MATVPGSAGGYICFVLEIFIIEGTGNPGLTYSVGEAAVCDGARREHALSVRLGEGERAVVSRDENVLSSWDACVLDGQTCQLLFLFSYFKKMGKTGRTRPAAPFSKFTSINVELVFWHPVTLGGQ